jgi:hypothetical protein
MGNIFRKYILISPIFSNRIGNFIQFNLFKLLKYLNIARTSPYWWIDGWRNFRGADRDAPGCTRQPTFLARPLVRGCGQQRGRRCAMATTSEPFKKGRYKNATSAGPCPLTWPTDLRKTGAGQKGTPAGSTYRPALWGGAMDVTGNNLDGNATTR